MSVIDFINNDVVVFDPSKPLTYERIKEFQERMNELYIRQMEARRESMDILYKGIENPESMPSGAVILPNGWIVKFRD